MQQDITPGTVKKVLLVDDNEDILFIGKIYLERSERFIVDIAVSAVEGYHLMQQQPYDIIVSDYDMPEIDGISFLNHIRREGYNIPFIICSSKERGEIKTCTSNRYSYIQKNGNPIRQYSELSEMILKSLPDSSGMHTDQTMASYSDCLRKDGITTGIHE
ncbi:MAG: response regulator [Methanospirillum sp.]|nr:response regulator [Methanospirillum sp.]